MSQSEPAETRVSSMHHANEVYVLIDNNRRNGRSFITPCLGIAQLPGQRGGGEPLRLSPFGWAVRRWTASTATSPKNHPQGLELYERLKVAVSSSAASGNIPTCPPGGVTDAPQPRGKTLPYAICHFLPEQEP